MSGWRGLLAGTLVLAALERLVSRPATAERAGGLFEGLTRGLDHFLSPDYPFFPKKGSTSSSTSASSSTAPAPLLGAGPLQPGQQRAAGPLVPAYPPVTAQAATALLV